MFHGNTNENSRNVGMILLEISLEIVLLFNINNQVEYGFYAEELVLRTKTTCSRMRQAACGVLSFHVVNTFEGSNNKSWLNTGCLRSLISLMMVLMTLAPALAIGRQVFLCW